MSQASAFLDVIYVLTLFLTNPSAIIAPMPLDPPVTSAVFPFKSNKFFILFLEFNYNNLLIVLLFNIISSYKI